MAEKGKLQATELEDLLVELSKQPVKSSAPFSPEVLDGYTEVDLALAIIELAPKIRKDILPIAVDVALRITEATDRTFALIALAHQLTDEYRLRVLNSAVEACFAMASEHYRTMAIPTLFNVLPNDERDKLFERAMQHTVKIPSLSHRAIALASLSQYVANPVKKTIA